MTDLTVEEAKTTLVEFLESTRLSLLRNKKQEIIDTALLKLYVDLQSPQLVKFLDSENNISLVECERYLTKEKRFNALALLYRNNKLDLKALEVWEKLGSGQYTDGKEDGVKETVAFLGAHEDKDLVFKHSPWVLRLKPMEGIKIFTESTRKRKIPRDEVVEFLQQHGEELFQEYLVHMIYTENIEDMVFHTQLAMHYTERVRVLVPDSGPDLKVKAGTEAGILGEIRSKLLQFLRYSNNYDVAKLLETLQDTKLYDELVIVYSKSEMPERSLDILVYTLRDHELAKQFCIESPDPSHDSNMLFCLLLKTFLKRDSTGAPHFQEEAIQLLNAHADQLDLLKVIEVIPEYLSISILSGYLHSMLRARQHYFRDGQILKNLMKTENLQVKCELVNARSSSVLITKDRNCPVCTKRISDKVFAAFPDLQVVHFKCFSDKNIHPITGQDFRIGYICK